MDTDNPRFVAPLAMVTKSRRNVFTTEMLTNGVGQLRKVLIRRSTCRAE